MTGKFIANLLFLVGAFSLTAGAGADSRFGEQVYIANKLGFDGNACAAIALTPCDERMFPSELASASFELAKRAVNGSLLFSYSGPARSNKRSILLGARVRWPELSPRFSLAAGVGSRDDDTTDLFPSTRLYTLGLSYEKGRLGLGLGLENGFDSDAADTSVRVTLIYSLGR